MNPQFVPDEVVTAAKMNQLPKGVLGYAQAVADQSGIGATFTDLTGLSVTVTVTAGRRLKITGQASCQQLTSAAVITGQIMEGTTILNRWARGRVETANAVYLAYGSAIVTPTAGSHTYKLQLSTSAATVTVQAASTWPAFIFVEDIGASS